LNNNKNSIKIINPKSRYFPNFKEILEYKDLLYFLILKDIKARYAQSVIGIGWAIIQPLFFMLVFTVIFGKLAKIDSEGVPYQIFSFTALVPWTFFSNAMADSSNSLSANLSLITNIYIPRILIPLSVTIGKFIDFIISFFILIILLIFYAYLPDEKILLIFMYVFLMFISAFAFGLLLGTMAIQYRDIKYALPFGIQLFMYASPVAYSTNMLPQKYHVIYSLNPMVTVIEGFRNIFLNTGNINLEMIVVSFLTSFLLLIIGIVYFSKTERIFADVV
jgi:lipopolysaccharide transport system permease protein|tara:strand:- start:296 stop:1126 length:831 start_codon:yes stop_codon:yes gene_type:complete